MRITLKMKMPPDIIFVNLKSMYNTRKKFKLKEITQTNTVKETFMKVLGTMESNPSLSLKPGST